MVLYEFEEDLHIYCLKSLTEVARYLMGDNPHELDLTELLLMKDAELLFAQRDVKDMANLAHRVGTFFQELGIKLFQRSRTQASVSRNLRVMDQAGLLVIEAQRRRN